MMSLRIESAGARNARGTKELADSGDHTGIPALEPLETRLLLSAFSLENGKYTYVDSVGSSVTVTLKGGGSGTVSFPGEDDRGTPTITITPASDKSTLTITVKGANKNVTTTVIADLTVEGCGLKSINAPRVNLLGELSMDASAGSKITLGDLRDGSVIYLWGESTVVTSLSLAYVYHDTFVYAPNLPLSVTAKEFFGEDNLRSVVMALYFTKVSVKGRMEAAIVAEGTDAKGVSIASLTVGREMWGIINVAGRINKLTVGAANNGYLTAGSIGTITTKGYRDFTGNYSGYWYFSVTVTGTDAKGVSIGSMKLAGPMIAESSLAGGPITFDVKGRINSLTTDAIYDRTKGGIVTIQAGSIGTLTSRGKMGDSSSIVSIQLTDCDVKGVSFNTMKVVGAFYGHVSATGKIATMNVGSMESGSITAASVGTLASGGKIGNTSTPVVFKVGQDSKGVSIGTLKATSAMYGNLDVSGRINVLSAGSVDGGSIKAGSIGTLAVKGYLAGTSFRKGNLLADVTLGGTGSGKTLGTASIVGELRSTVTIHGNVGTLSAESMTRAKVTIHGKASSITTQSKMDRKPGTLGFVQVQGGGAITASNGTFKISGTDFLYAV